MPLSATKQEGLIRKYRYLDVATRAFSSKPRGEEAGRVEVMLKVAYHLSGGDGNGFVDCYRSMCKNRKRKEDGKRVPKTPSIIFNFGFYLMFSMKEIGEALLCCPEFIYYRYSRGTRTWGLNALSWFELIYHTSRYSVPYIVYLR